MQPPSVSLWCSDTSKMGKKHKERAVPGALTPQMIWGGWTGRMTARNAHRVCGGMESENLLLSKSPSVPAPPLSMSGADLGGF